MIANTTVSRILKRFLLTSCALASITFSGCDGIGLFATIAVSEKIEEGSLPEGLSASAVVNASAGINNLDDYDFFSGGVRLWARNNLAAGNKWFQLPLVDDNGTSWDGIQSIVASNEAIWLALIKITGTSTRSALATVTHNGTDLEINRITNTPGWTSTSSGYTVLRLFRPPLANTVYVNVINQSGTFGEIDDNTLDASSSLFSIPGGSADWGAAAQTHANIDNQLNGVARRYVTGVADNGGTIRISATTSSVDTSGGILMDQTGTVIDYSSSAAVGGVTWLDSINAGAGAFIMSGTAPVSGVRSIFASITGADASWETVGQTSGDYTVESFIDVSATTAGAGLVLAATRSVVSDSTSEPSGYFEITVDPLLANWSFNTNPASYNFAEINNYQSSELTDSSILGMGFGGDGSGGVGDVLYIGSFGKGLWAIDTSLTSPDWRLE